LQKIKGKLRVLGFVRDSNLKMLSPSLVFLTMI